MCTFDGVKQSLTQPRLPRTFCGALNSKRGKLAYLSFISEKGPASLDPPPWRLRANLSATGICESEFAAAAMVPFSDRRGRYAFASRREGK